MARFRTKDIVQDIYIPYGAYRPTPVARRQGNLAHLHSLKFSAHVAKNALAKRGIDPSVFDHQALGMTVPQQSAFYGFTWLMALMALIGNASVSGPTINQACVTGVRVWRRLSTSTPTGSTTMNFRWCGVIHKGRPACAG